MNATLKPSQPYAILNNDSLLEEELVRTPTAFEHCFDIFNQEYDKFKRIMPFNGVYAIQTLAALIIISIILVASINITLSWGTLDTLTCALIGISFAICIISSVVETVVFVGSGIAGAKSSKNSQSMLLVIADIVTYILSSMVLILIGVCLIIVLASSPKIVTPILGALAALIYLLIRTAQTVSIWRCMVKESIGNTGITSKRKQGFYLAMSTYIVELVFTGALFGMAIFALTQPSFLDLLQLSAEHTDAICKVFTKITTFI
ncbi:hypothetical protein NEHOM01_0315 [Nematocida homosporus]|uniref:uncharacterized protein n=1 Tax=Nematocida homosporus TaxID=1912981 RepID=UPI002221035A|nr:uncharacterized protein NEHOM01_0315 [Nematocida homosporus]KAI5184640.1 hypothetical protein NEHOM01_0315 [Nematocida homosporus]